MTLSSEVGSSWILIELNRDPKDTEYSTSIYNDRIEVELTIKLKRTELKLNGIRQTASIDYHGNGHTFPTIILALFVQSLKAKTALRNS